MSKLQKQILSALEEGPMRVPDLMRTINYGLSRRAFMQALLRLDRKGLVTYDGSLASMEPRRS